ncbi:family 10 glycosylhydrolase [Cohnella sp. CFH 77786]|uniref:family 10 glycosylhydrolase n=1 Tax=Cohnella sp. CFH 77786 TaxID=2662265 RepID=UPI001C610773|nr:family 10 glycosylhydrolase [Cohnella sp. CFH 77786]MBW5446270.1 family 10 glycosylhydrolase [Cohnella sp. CFH 77786]
MTRFRKWFSGLFAVLLGLSLLVPVSHAQTSQAIRIYLDGQWVRSDVSPYILPKANLTMVPVRVISQGLGASVAWTQKTKTVTIRKSGVTIVMIVGQKTATVNGAKVPLDAPAALKSSRVTVPLRFISERLGLQVKWNPDYRWIQLISKPGHEIKGAWVSTVYNLDWPSANSYGNSDRQKEEYAALLDDLQGMGLNAVYVQVRPNADALYPTKLAPWSQYLTGVQGQDPGYDPLSYMLEETHRRGMEFHAWFNPFRAGTDASTAALAPEHVALAHPDWIVNAGGKLYVNPGIPAARQHIIDVIMEVVKRYPIDGVHLDDYFYPEGVEFDDEAAFRAYNPKQLDDKGEWRRDNINDFIKKLGQSIHAAKPRLSFGISPFGVWRNRDDDPTGSDTRAGITAYDDMYADVRTWIRGNWIDYVMPQIYWSIGYSPARYETLVEWWAREVDGSKVKLYIGHAPYKLGTEEAGWQSADEIVAQLKYNEAFPQVRGDVFFSAKDLRRNPLNVVPALRAYYKES